MSRSIVIAWVLLFAAATAAIGVSLSRAAAAKARAEDSIARLEAVARSQQDLLAVRSRLPTWAARQGTPADAAADHIDLAPAITATLEAGGLPATVMSTFAADPPADGPSEGGMKVVRRSATATLSPLTLPQLGAFLQRWRDRVPDWTIAAIELAPMPLPPSASITGNQTGRDLPLRALITLQSTSIRATAAINAAANPSVPTHPLASTARGGSHALSGERP